MSFTRRSFECLVPGLVGAALVRCSGSESVAPTSSVPARAVPRPRPSLVKLDSDREIATHPLFVIKNYGPDFGIDVDLSVTDRILRDPRLGINFNRPGAAKAFIALVDYSLNTEQAARRAEAMMRVQLPRVVQEYNADQGNREALEGSFYLRAVSMSDAFQELVGTGIREADSVSFAKIVTSAFSINMSHYSVMAIRDSSPFFSVVKPPVNLPRLTADQVGRLKPVRLTRFPLRLIDPTPTSRSVRTI